MRNFRSRFDRLSDWQRQGAVHCVLAASMLLAFTLCTFSLEYWSGRTIHMVNSLLRGMTWESYRNLALITAFFGWIISRAPEKQTQHRRPFRP